MRKKGFFALYLLVLFFPLLELAFRIVGYRPYEQLPFSIESIPEFCIVPDDRLGFALQPGTFEVNINEGLNFSVTHTADSVRSSSNERTNPDLPQIFLMGCSYTYGWGINDAETFAHLLQNQFPQYQLHNFAVPGFGTVQSYLQLLREVERGHVPALVIINYADFHDDRNALSSLYRKHLYMGFERSNTSVLAHFAESRIPYLAKQGSTFSIAWDSWRNIYSNWRGREIFSMVNFLQDGRDRITSQYMDTRTYSLHAFQMIRELCTRHDIRLLVSGLTQTDATKNSLAHLARLQIEVLDISVDLSLAAFNNAPFDSHPNAAAHNVFAEKLRIWIEEEKGSFEEKK